MVWILVLGLWLAALAATWLAVRRGRLRSPWHLDVAALGLLALAVLGFFWRVVTGQNWMPADGGDLVSFLYPTYRFAASALQDGFWPLWNPHLYGGAPHVGDIQAGFLYPPNLLLFLLQPDFPYAHLQWLSIGHVWFAGAGMFLLLARGAGLRRPAAMSGALAFMFCDSFLVHFGNLNFNAVASWLPWVLWAYGWEPAAGRHGLGRAVLAGVLLAVATLAGHIQATLFSVLALAGWAALQAWLGRREPAAGRSALLVLARLLIALAVMALLAAAVLLPALQLSGYTARADWRYTETAGYSLAPAQWIGWLAPGFFGRGPQFHWGAWPRVEIGYVGILPLLLAGLALLLRRDRRTWTLFGLALGSFLLALGIYAAPHGWLTLLPGFGQLRAPARFVLLTAFALAGLAAIGLDAVLAPWVGRGRLVFERFWRWTACGTAAVLAVAVPLAYVTLLLMQDRDPAIVLRVSISLLAVVTFAGLLVASLLWLTARRGGWASPRVLGWLAAGLIFVDLASLGAYQDLGENDPSAGFDHPAIVEFLSSQPGPYRIDTRTQIEALWQPDTALLHGLEDVSGVANPSLLAEADRYWQGLGSRSSRLYDLLNVRYIIALKDDPLDWDKFALVFDGDPRLNVYENRNALPRAFLAGAVQAVPDHAAAWDAIHAPGFDPAVSAVVEGAAPVVVGGGSVSNLRQGTNSLSLAVDAPGPSLLVISQIWYPGWRVRVDGRAQGEPLRVDYLFQGVALEPGPHTVELRFSPPAWLAGWLVSAVTAAALLIAVVAGRCKIADGRLKIRDRR